MEYQMKMCQENPALHLEYDKRSYRENPKKKWDYRKTDIPILGLPSRVTKPEIYLSLPKNPDNKKRKQDVTRLRISFNK